MLLLPFESTVIRHKPAKMSADHDIIGKVCGHVNKLVALLKPLALHRRVERCGSVPLRRAVPATLRCAQKLKLFEH
jgi:hypothetical protein